MKATSILGFLSLTPLSNAFEFERQNLITTATYTQQICSTFLGTASLAKVPTTTMVVTISLQPLAYLTVTPTNTITPSPSTGKFQYIFHTLLYLHKQSVTVTTTKTFTITNPIITDTFTETETSTETSSTTSKEDSTHNSVSHCIFTRIRHLHIEFNVYNKLYNCHRRFNFYCAHTRRLRLPPTNCCKDRCDKSERKRSKKKCPSTRDQP